MNSHIPVEAFPPGEYLKDEIEARGWSQIEFAEIIERDPKTVGMIIAGKMRVTEESAKLFEAALDIDAQYWLNLESSYRLALSRQTQASSAIPRRAELHTKFPVKEMVQKGWIEKTSNPDVLEHQLLRFFDLPSIDATPQFAHAARKNQNAEKTSVQIAWLYRARQIAVTQLVGEFTQAKLENATSELKQLLEHAEDIRRVPSVLTRAGIRFVIVEPIAGSGIDGACFWLNPSSPVVAMTTRYDRIDNFWFVLLHELRHIAHRHGQDHPILDEEMESNNKDGDEAKVNREAAEFLIPELDDFIVRSHPLYSARKIEGFAKRIRVHPGLVIGQLQFRNEVPRSHFNKYKCKIRHIICFTAHCDGWGYLQTTGRNSI